MHYMSLSYHEPHLITPHGHTPGPQLQPPRGRDATSPASVQQLPRLGVTPDLVPANKRLYFRKSLIKSWIWNDKWRGVEAVPDKSSPCCADQLWTSETGSVKQKEDAAENMIILALGLFRTSHKQFLWSVIKTNTLYLIEQSCDQTLLLLFPAPHHHNEGPDITHYKPQSQT